MTERNETYIKTIKKHLYFNAPLTLLELSKLMHLSIPLLIKLVDKMIERGEVVEAGFAESSGGRRPVLYRLNGNLQYIVAVWVDQLITRVAILDTNRQVIGEVKKIELHLNNDPDLLPRFAKEINSFIENSSIDKSNIIGVGIGMPGFIDVKKGINHSFFGIIEKKSTVSFLKQALNLPVLIDNDSSLIALAEHKFGAAKGKQNVMVINLGWGVGLGIIQNGVLFRGHNGYAGEFSHIPLFTNDKICQCGKTGCLETETSLNVILNKVIEGLQAGRASNIKHDGKENTEEFANEVMQAASNGDSFAIKVLSEAAYHVGRGIAILVHILNPEMIILSGLGSAGGKVWLAPIQQAINEHCIPRLAEDLQILVSDMGTNAGIIGAAALVMDHNEEIQKKSKKHIHHINQLNNVQ